jgi:hypothetical protein
MHWSVRYFFCCPVNDDTSLVWGSSWPFAPKSSAVQYGGAAFALLWQPARCSGSNELPHGITPRSLWVSSRMPSDGAALLAYAPGSRANSRAMSAVGSPLVEYLPVCRVNARIPITHQARRVEMPRCAVQIRMFANSCPLLPCQTARWHVRAGYPDAACAASHVLAPQPRNDGGRKSPQVARIGA